MLIHSILLQLWMEIRLYMLRSKYVEVEPFVLQVIADTDTAHNIFIINYVATRRNNYVAG